MKTIYCVEDDKSIRELVVYALKASGFEAQGFENAAGFYRSIEWQLPDLVLLDIMLPEEDGLAVLRKLRASPKTAHLPVILLTAKSTEYDKVLGLDSGADDYICKPFGVMELISRVKAVLRRVTPREDQEELIVDTIVLNNSKHTVLVNNQEVHLTLKEYELLYYLMKNRGLVLTRDKILAAIWGYEFEGETRTIDMHIKTLRQKLGESGNLIETIRGVGYRMGESK
ncbi:MAG: response regulator transcription factor [Peptococcaceae bacterium]|nr:response regulator transcription factor [Peptococcaceae bacterium]